LVKLKEAGKVDCVFNLCDEGFMNDPERENEIPALLEILDIPYTGSGPTCLTRCHDKFGVESFASGLGVPVANFFILGRNDSMKQFGNKIKKFPVIVKPNHGEGSLGITSGSVVNTRAELFRAVSELRENFSYQGPIVVEEFLPGIELTVGIVGNPGSYSFISMTKEDYSQLPQGLPPICGWEAKWDPVSPYASVRPIPAISSELEGSLIEENSLLMFKKLNCRDYARFDWRYSENGRANLLEVNPNPGWCFDGHLAKMFEFEGKTYPEMLEAILIAAEKRFSRVK
jgi:D-alanine-D-alanine ligase